MAASSSPRATGVRGTSLRSCGQSQATPCASASSAAGLGAQAPAAVAVLPRALRLAPAPPEPPWVELLLALPRPKVMMRLWSTLAQLGVRRITLTNACRVEKPYFSSQATDPAKYVPELLEGLEQACCTRMPEVRVEMRLKPFLEDALDSLCPPSEVLRLLCHPGPASASVAEAVAAARPAAPGPPRRTGPPPRGVLLAVGPEGGWVDYELELLRSRGFEQVSLGPRILTTDVAVVSLVSLAMDALAASSRAAAPAPEPHLAPPSALPPADPEQALRAPPLQQVEASAAEAYGNAARSSEDRLRLAADRLQQRQETAEALSVDLVTLREQLREREATSSALQLEVAQLQAEVAAARAAVLAEPANWRAPADVDSWEAPAEAKSWAAPAEVSAWAEGR
ncbi:unnamed protein product [Prorocentrum cordatum]|uniref:16S rRNA (uracil(1498)-N(3))-methyltransferase n=1 Tax=Prorocentrum cordatum TaxID=2364126 RepID=A0ABN9WYW2_9DINO|nr:unnamed protein product [Polarella glacialis]